MSFPKTHPHFLIIASRASPLKKTANLILPICKRIRACLCLLLLTVSAVQAQQPPEGFISDVINLGGKNYTAYHPEGFKLEPITFDLEIPRIIHLHGDRMFIGSRSGKVYWLDPPYAKPIILSELDDYPHSAVVRGEFIYIATKSRILRASYNNKTRYINPEDFEQYLSLPGGKGGHTSRTLKSGPDNQLYVSLGIRGNCSDEYLDNAYPLDKRRGGVFRIEEKYDQPILVPFASGLRNPVGFDWHPKSETMYASNNGPDHLGFDSPPEYFSRLTEGSFHGMPWYQFDGKQLIKDTCQQSTPPKPIESVTLPSVVFDSRNAPMDVAFIPDHANATEYIGDAIVALHGSWATAGDGSKNGDKTTRRPPKLVRVVFNNGKPVKVVDLLTGMQSVNTGDRWARPVGVAVAPDGDIYFTSDGGAKGLFRLKKTP
jgi:glucose/arabinose dehydrogenase